VVEELGREPLRELLEVLVAAVARIYALPAQVYPDRVITVALAGVAMWLVVVGVQGLLGYLRLEQPLVVMGGLELQVQLVEL
jgi:hypothetical protein